MSDKTTLADQLRAIAAKVALAADRHEQEEKGKREKLIESFGDQLYECCVEQAKKAAAECRREARVELSDCMNERAKDHFREAVGRAVIRLSKGGLTVEQEFYAWTHRDEHGGRPQHNDERCTVIMRW